MQAKFDYETERLKQIIRQRELEKERRFSQNHDEKPFSPPEMLFHQANQLTSILDVEEKKIQVSTCCLHFYVYEVQKNYLMVDYRIFC
nr:unnamed protein product [Callosobruchus analis]